MVIVTQNQYILAQKIFHVTMDERKELDEVRLSNGRYKTVVDRYYQITVIYEPEVTNINNNIRDQMRECSVKLVGHVHAHKVFANLIQQIREQLPDQLYLDTALERMIAGTDMELLKDMDLNKDKYADLEKAHDRKPKVIRKPRKAKRRSKKVFRKAK
jgi:hypothetical protein